MHDSQRYRDNAADCLLAARTAHELHYKRLDLLKAGTPAGMQLDRGVKASFPARTSSLSCFIRSLTQGFRFGLVTSAIRYVAWPPAPFATNGCAGSFVTGGKWPGTAAKLGPPPPTPTQPT
jgi:hypothetical protein